MSGVAAAAVSASPLITLTKIKPRIKESPLVLQLACTLQLFNIRVVEKKCITFHCLELNKILYISVVVNDIGCHCYHSNAYGRLTQKKLVKRVNIITTPTFIKYATFFCLLSPKEYF